MHQIIGDIIASTRRRVENLPHTPDIHSTLIPRSLEQSIRYIRAMQKIPVISEVKPASPTTFNRDVAPADAADIARKMENAGAVAISVLTEPHFFHGSLENLMQVRKAVNIPVLRKDFIIDTRQLYEVQSDLILLIAGILGEKLPEFIWLASKIGFQPLVEVHNHEELVSALSADAKIIGINNRDLNTMKVDLAATEALAPEVRKHDSQNVETSAPGRIIISESGIFTPQDVRRVVRAGADAILVGTSIMQGDIFYNTKQLVEAGTSYEH